MNKNNELLNAAIIGLNRLCEEIQQNFPLPEGGAELLIIELTAACIMPQNPVAVQNYLALLATQIDRPDFDEELMQLARDRVLDSF